MRHAFLTARIGGEGLGLRGRGLLKITKHNSITMWQDWINGVLGVAVIVVAFLELSGDTLLWTLSLLGAGIAIFSFWSAGMYVNDASAAHYS